MSDEEIDYGLFNKNDSRGSSYYDINILQTPILEAFTDNAASLKSKCLSIPRTNLLYLPIIKLNETFNPSTKRHTNGVYQVLVNKDTEDTVSVVSGQVVQGLILGETLRRWNLYKIRSGIGF